MDWLLFAPLLPIGRMRRLAFFLSYLALAAGAYLTLYLTNNLVVPLLFIWPLLCIHARRLHDMGASGWWVVIPGAVEIVCLVVGGLLLIMAMFLAATHNQGTPAFLYPGLGVCGFAALLSLSFALWLSLTPSSPSDRYGARAPGPVPATPAG
jgi:uncharacterized membrane protein YhaH (DUF805 family)